MRAWIVVICCVAFGWLTSTRNAFAQAVEANLDEESGEEQTAQEEALDRLRRSPIDLRSASENDLLQIPHLRRREASAILRAVRDGSIVELRAVDLIPGVRHGTAERIAPYVILNLGTTVARSSTRVRSSASWRQKNGAVELTRRQHDVRIDGSRDAQVGESLRLEFRRSGLEPSAPFAFVRIPVPFPGWSLFFGDLDVRGGSALLDAGRRTSIYRPSEWERRLLSDARILPGYDRGTSVRGAALRAAYPGRVVQTSTATDNTGRRSGMLSWTEEWPLNLTTHVIRDLRTSGSSFRVEGNFRPFAISVEGCYAEHAASYVASCRREEPGRYSFMTVARSLRRIATPGVARVGDRTTDEVGASVVMQHSVGTKARWYVVGDAARVVETERSRVPVWRSFTAVVGTVVQLAKRSSIGVEWTEAERDRDRVRRWTLRSQQPLFSRLQCSLVLAHRTEHETHKGATTGLLTMATLSWAKADLSWHIRWTAGDGDPAVEFWSLGPGPSRLSGLQRYAGRTGELRGVVQWQPAEAFECGIGVSWRSQPTEELRASILLEIHL